jgi:hypothetical protein
MGPRYSVVPIIGWLPAKIRYYSKKAESQMNRIALIARNLSKFHLHPNLSQLNPDRHL